MLPYIISPLNAPFMQTLQIKEILLLDYIIRKSVIPINVIKAQWDLHNYELLRIKAANRNFSY